MKGKRTQNGFSLASTDHLPIIHEYSNILEGGREADVTKCREQLSTNSSKVSVTPTTFPACRVPFQNSSFSVQVACD